MDREEQLRLRRAKYAAWKARQGQAATSIPDGPRSSEPGQQDTWFPKVQPAPERGPVTRIVVGPQSRFKEGVLAPFGKRLAHAFGDGWLLVFSGKGYVDLDQPVLRETARSYVSMFTLRFPRATVEWLA